MLSRPGAVPDFNFLKAASSSSTVKSDDRLASAVAALESEVTSRDVQRASGKRPLFSSCEAIAFAVTGHLECAVLLPVSLFMVCHALRRCLPWWWPAGAREGGGCSCRPIWGCSLC